MTQNPTNPANPARPTFGVGTACRRAEIARVHLGRRPAPLGARADRVHICLDVADLWLRGTPIGRIVGSDAMNYGWQRLNDAYSARLGID